MKDDEKRNLHLRLSEALRTDPFALDKDSLRPISEVFGDSWRDYRHHIEVLSEDAKNGKAPSQHELIKIFCQLVLMDGARPSDPLLKQVAEWLLPLLNLPLRHDASLRKGVGMRALNLSKRWPRDEEPWLELVYSEYRSIKESKAGEQLWQDALVEETAEKLNSWPDEWRAAFLINHKTGQEKDFRELVRYAISKFE